MNPATATLLALAAGTYMLKAAAPLLLGDRQLAPWLQRLASLLPASLLAALVAVSTFTADGAMTVDARMAGLVAAATALMLRAPFVLVVLLAAATTALVRLVA